MLKGRLPAMYILLYDGFNRSLSHLKFSGDESGRG